MHRNSRHQWRSGARRPAASIAASLSALLLVSACASDGDKDSNDRLGGNAAPPPEGWQIPAGPGERTSHTPEGPRGSEARPPESPPHSSQSPERTRALAQEAHTRGDFYQAALRWRDLLRMTPEDGEAWFGLARSLARSDKASDAAEAARGAWKHGVTALDGYLNETDFALIRDDAAWIGLMAELKARAARDE